MIFRKNIKICFLFPFYNTGYLVSNFHIHRDQICLWCVRYENLSINNVKDKKQNKTKQNKNKQKQTKTKQNKTKQNKTKQKTKTKINGKAIE